MARITFSIAPDSTPQVVDEPEEDPAYGGRRHVWLELDDAEGSMLVLKPAGYGLPTDVEIIASTSLLIAALEELRIAARERIGDPGDHYARPEAVTA